jgi:nucleoside-diphosphate-sugar epimerase
VGWQAKIGLHEGVENTYRWFLDNAENLRGL